jgi:hypothetical protein
VDPNIAQVQKPIHRVPVSKRDKERSTLKRYEELGIIKKVIEPTDWCSNELIRETKNKFCICIDPSQTINEAIFQSNVSINKPYFRCQHLRKTCTNFVMLNVLH